MIFFINLIFLSTFIPIFITFFNMELRIVPKYIALYFLGIALCTTVDCNVPHTSKFFLLLSLSCIALTLCCIFKTTYKILFMAELASYFVISVLNQFARFLFLQFTLSNYINDQFSVLLQSIFVFIIVSSVSYFIYARRQNKLPIPLIYILFLASVIIIDASVITVVGDYLFNKIGNLYTLKVLIIYLLLILGILIQIILLIHMIKSRDLHKENERLARQYLENQTRYYEYLVQREEDTRKFRHDIRNHISMLNMLFQENKIDECKDYLQDLTAHYENIHNAISVNNCIADAILNKYYYEAQNHDIELTVTGHFPAECNLPAYDICTIFSNLLENALKAVIDCDGKNISVGCRYTDTEILLSIENDSDYVELDADGMPRTSKNDVSQHGFGLKNVQQCVRQNNGHMSIQTNDKRFKVILSLSRGNDNESCNNR